MDLNGQIGAAEFDQLESLADFVISEDSVDSRRTGIVQKEDRSERPVAIITPHSAIQSKEVHLQQDSLRYPSMDNEHFYRRSTSRERNERYRFYGSPRRFSPSQPRTPSPRRFSVSPRRFSPGRPCSPNRPRTGSRPRTPNRPLTPSRPRTPSPNYYRGDRVGANNTNESFERFRVAPPPDPVPVPPYDGSISRQYDEPRPLSPRTDEDWYTAVNCFQFLCENVPVRRKRDPRYSRSRSRSRTRSRSPARRRRRRRSYSRGSADGRFKKMKSRSSRTSSSSSSSSSSASDTDADKKSKGYSTQKSLPERDEDDFTNTQKREAMTKQRDDYLLQLLGLEAEVDRLKKQQQTLSARDPDTNSLFLIENVRLQGVLSGNIASIRTAVEKMNNMFNLPAPENPPLTKDGLPVSAQPIDKVDTGRPWCQYCNVFPLSLKALLIHYSSVAHRRKLQEHGVAEDPWINDIDPEEEKAAIDCMVIEQLVGYQFVLPADGWYCQLCHIWFGDHRTATIHMYSPDHVKGYTTFSENHSEWTQEWTSCRKTALDNYDEKSAVTDETDQKKRTQWKEDGMRLDGMRSALKREDNSRENSKKRSTNRKNNKKESSDRLDIHSKPSVSHNTRLYDTERKTSGTEKDDVVDQWHPNDISPSKDKNSGNMKSSPARNSSKTAGERQQSDRIDKVRVKETSEEKKKLSSNNKKSKEVREEDMREDEQNKIKKDAEQRNKEKDIDREKTERERKERRHRERRDEDKNDKGDKQSHSSDSRSRNRDHSSRDQVRGSERRHRSRSVDSDRNRTKGKQPVSKEVSPTVQKNRKVSETENSKSTKLTSVTEPSEISNKWRAVPTTISDGENPRNKLEKSTPKGKQSTEAISGEERSPIPEENNKSTPDDQFVKPVVRPIIGKMPMLRKPKEKTVIHPFFAHIIAKNKSDSPKLNDGETVKEMGTTLPVFQPFATDVWSKDAVIPTTSTVPDPKPPTPATTTWSKKTDEWSKDTSMPPISSIATPMPPTPATTTWSKKTDEWSKDTSMPPISSIPTPMPPTPATTTWSKKTDEWTKNTSMSSMFTIPKLVPPVSSIPKPLPPTSSISVNPIALPVANATTTRSLCFYELPTQLDTVPKNDVNNPVTPQHGFRPVTSVTIKRKQIYDNFINQLHRLQGESKWVRELGFDIRVPVLMQPGENSFEQFYSQVVLKGLITEEEAVMMQVQNSKFPTANSSTQANTVNGFDRYNPIILIPEQLPFILFYNEIVKPWLVNDAEIQMIQGRCRNNNPPAVSTPVMSSTPFFNAPPPPFTPHHVFQPPPSFPPF